VKSNITQWRDKILAANPFTEPATESSSSQATMRKISLLCGFIIGTILYGFRKMLARRHNQNHEYTKTNRCTYCSCQPDRRLYGKAISPLITTTSLSRKTVCSNTIGQPARCGCHSSRATPGDGMRDVVQGYTGGQRRNLGPFWPDGMDSSTAGPIHARILSATSFIRAPARTPGIIP
jgi:hypothetical protein